MKPIVAIVGRPNVGKSTFFNRLTRTRDALVDDFPGVTRDRHYGEVSWDDAEFTLVDTGGFAGGDAFASKISFQVMQAIEGADVIILMLDGKEGISPFDTDIIAILRQADKKVFYVVNKIDGRGQEAGIAEFYSLGLDKLYPLSAEHRYGLNDFLDDLVQSLPQAKKVAVADPDREIIKLAVVGRPNVGKSSLINRILGQERLLVSDIPGTTRDAIDTLCQVNGRPYLLIDTAGIRRKGKVTKKLEKFSIIKALKSLDRCDVALIVIDAEEGITDQDINIAGYAHDRGCGCVIVLNKWDRVLKNSRTVNEYLDKFRQQAKFLSFAPVLTVSALSGQRVVKIFKLIDDVFSQYSERIGTGRLNKVIEDAVAANTPAMHRGRRIKFYYAAQVSTRPPTIVCFVNYPEAVHFSYQRYLVNCIRQATGLDQAPLRLIFRQREGRKLKGRR